MISTVTPKEDEQKIQNGHIKKVKITKRKRVNKNNVWETVKALVKEEMERQAVLPQHAPHENSADTSPEGPAQYYRVHAGTALLTASLS